MKKKILILEDNKRDFATLTGFIQREFPEIDFYPRTEDENSHLKKCVKQLFSPNENKKATAKAFVESLELSSFDGMILDYLLDSKSDLLNGVVLYQKLGLSQKAVLFTKLKSAEFTDMKAEIDRHGLSERIHVVQKGASKLTVRQEQEYGDSIREHLLGIVSDEKLPVVVILTALLEEYNAVRFFLSHVKEVKNDGISYEAGIFKFKDIPIAKVFIRECGAKMSNAAQETQRAIQFFQPSSIFFVGIAGSRKPNDFGLADVVFAEKIYSYEGVKATRKTELVRPESEGCSTRIAEIAKKERRSDEWHTLLGEAPGMKPQANLGVIASGNQLIEDLDSETGKLINRHYNDTSAVEMEGYAFAAAAKRQVTVTPDYAVVRGISDIIPTNGQHVAVDNRPKDAKQKASASAAAFTYWLLYKLYTSSN